MFGAYVRIQGGRYLAGFAVIDGTNVVEQQNFPAPPDETEAGQLGELYARAADLLDETEPGLFALKLSETPRDPDARFARHAEGAILGAVGRRRSIEVTHWFGRSLCKPAGLTGKARNAEAIEALCSRLSPVPAEDEVRQAAAAALAASMQRTN